jgi:broad specificity phosphatase PhoE
MEKQQRIFKLIFVRHGVALHNVVDQRSTTNLSHDLFDPPLTMEGKFQAVVVGEAIRNWIREQHQNLPPGAQPQSFTVISSPLTRCLQTGMYAFGIPNDDSSSPAFLCHEDVREACGIYSCDRRRTKSQLQTNWTRNYCGVQFTSGMSEQDEIWSANRRETIHEVQIRIEKFLLFLIASIEPAGNATTAEHDNNENDVFVVITHGVWIETLLQMYHAPSHFQIPKRVRNADAYYCECVSALSNNQQFLCMRNFQQIYGGNA